MYEGGSVAPRSAGTDGPDMETSARHRSTRNTSALAPSGLSPPLEAEVKDNANTRDGVSGDHCVDQRDGKEQSTLGAERIRVCKQTIQLCASAGCVTV